MAQFVCRTPKMGLRLSCNILSIYISNYLKYRGKMFSGVSFTSWTWKENRRLSSNQQIESAYEIRSVVDLGFHVVSSTWVSVRLIVQYLTSFTSLNSSCGLTSANRACWKTHQCWFPWTGAPVIWVYNNDIVNDQIFGVHFLLSRDPQVSSGWSQ